jgi:hypothetical protein
MVFRVFKVQALTDQGRLAIQHNLEERSKIKGLDKLIMNKLFDVVVSDGFGLLEFRGKTQVYVDPGVMRTKLEESMKNEGCSEKDFKVMIE